MNDMTLNWYKSIKNRTSVREFSDTVDQKTFTELKNSQQGSTTMKHGLFCVQRTGF